MKNLAQELFLLTTTLSQLSDKEKIIQLFIECMNNIFPGHSFDWITEQSAEYDRLIEVCTRKKKYGYISTSHNHIDATSNNMILNAVQLLAIFLEKTELENLLFDQRNHLQILVNEQTNELNQANIRLEKELSERRRTEETLRQSEGKYRSLIHNIQAAVVVHGSGTEILACNLKAQELLGLTEDQMLGKTVIDPAWRFFKEDGSTMPVDEFPVNRVVTSSQPLRNYIVGIHRPASNDDIWAFVNADPVLGDNDEIVQIIVTFIDITERKIAEQERIEHIHFLESMDEINRAIQGSNDLEKILSDVLDAVLSVFDCDRAFLLYPCNPESETWQVPMERNKAEFPGVLELGLEMPMKPDVAMSLRILLDSEGPVKFGPGTEYPLPEEVSEQFGFKSFMSTAIYPKLGSAWQFGMHQCSYARAWTKEEERLFSEIGRRLEDLLTGFLANKTLQESEERFRSLVSQAADAFYLLDCDGNILDVNQSACIDLGYNKEELLKMNISEIDIDVQRQKHKERFWDNLKPGEPVTFEGMHLKKDNSMFPVEVRLGILDLGQNKYMLGLARDITERKQAEKAILESAEKNRALIEAIPDMMFILDKKGTYIDFKAERESELAVPPELIIGKNISDAGFSSEQLESIHICIDNVLKSNISESIEYDLDITGGKGYFDAKIAKLNNDEVVAVIRNITDRKLAEEALHQSERRFREIFDNVLDGLFLIEIIDEGLSRIIEANPAFVRLTGIPRSFSIGKTLETVFPDKVASVINVNFRHCIGTGQPIEEEMMLDLPTSSHYLLAILVPTLDDTGKIYRVIGILRDITEMKLAENALRESEERYKNLLHSVTNYIYTVQVEEGRAKSVMHGPGSVKVTGYSSEEFNRNAELWYQIIHEQDRDAITRAKDWLLAGNIVQPLEHRIYHKDGSLRWIHHTLVPHFDDQNQLLAYDGLIEDITARKKAEIKVLRSEQRMRLHTEQSPLGFLEWDEHFHAMEWNKACEGIFGYTREEAIGHHAKELILPPEVHHLVEGIYASLMSQTGGQHSVNENITKDGRIIICEWFNTTLTDENGKAYGVASVCKDITEQIKNEIALRESEECYRHISDNASDIIWTLDVNSMKFTYISPSIKNIQGYTQEEALNLKLSQFFPNDAYHLVVAKITEIKNLIDRGEFDFRQKNLFELQGVCKNGQIIDCEVNLSFILDTDGKLFSIHGITRDITEWKQINSEIQKSKEKISKLSQHLEYIREEEKKNVAYLIHDDIGQSLTALKLKLKLFGNAISQKNEIQKKRQQEMTELIDETINRVRTIASELRPAILDQLGLMSAISWQLEQFKDNTNIDYIINSNIEYIQLNDYYSSVYFRILQEGLTNIIRHARASKVEIKIYLENRELELSIIDNGIGIPDTKINNPEAFGLMAIKERVSSINGQFVIDSTENIGTKLIIRSKIPENDNIANDEK